MDWFLYHRDLCHERVKAVNYCHKGLSFRSGRRPSHKFLNVCLFFVFFFFETSPEKSMITKNHIDVVHDNSQC